VLWVLVGLTALTLASLLAAREALAGARNRTNLTKAGWVAEGCAEAARAAVDGALATTDAAEARGGPPMVWRTLDRRAAQSPLWRVATSACEVRLVAAGEKVDLTAADSEQLRALFVAMSISSDRSDSLADALLDWQDADDLPRPRGAEREWYATNRQATPRNGSIADLAELAQVRGFARIWAELDSVAWVEPGRLVLDRAPLPALASLPGFTAEALARAVEWRGGGSDGGLAVRDPLEVPALAARLTPASARALLARRDDLAHLQTPEPDAWLLITRATEGAPAVVAEVELRLIRAGTRAVVIRRRTRP
jgi:type II secretory pathway component PulK